MTGKITYDKVAGNIGIRGALEEFGHYTPLASKQE
jgi:hypothetical protein